MATFREFAIGAVLVALFAFALIGFGVQLAEQNDTNLSISDDEIINRTYSDLEDEINDISTNSNTQKDSWYSDIPVLGDATVIFQSITGITRTFFSGTVGIYNLIITLISETIGIPTVILNGVVAIIIIASLIMLWSLFKAGT